ncbi:MAG: DegT/DnrJ/EryC1/StrS family aminotransferase [Candidatus Omnitrophota bacterium]|nr:DegT/DnrJ/EryC1/StrS family aminotransferase [Candidatus Omnitrophota bacterium]
MGVEITAPVRRAAQRFIPNAKPFFSPADKAQILASMSEILDGMLTLGPLVQRLEQDFAHYVGVSHAVAVHSCTSALEIALRFFEVEGRDVLVPAQTFVATANAVITAGGRPVIIDVDRATQCLTAELVETAIGPKTAGVIVVNMHGLIPPDFEAIRAVCRRRSLFLIEDAAHSPGAIYRGVKSGALADAACFSLYATKVLTAGEGGVLTTGDPCLAAFARSVRDHGMEETRTQCVRVGSNMRCDEFRAAVALNQLGNLEVFVARRNTIARLYEEQLADEALIRLPARYTHIRHAYWKFPVSLADGLDPGCIARELLQSHGIQVSQPYAPPVHLQPYYRQRYGYAPGALPNVEWILSHYVCLPMHVGLTDDEVAHVVESLLSVLRKAT